MLARCLPPPPSDARAPILSAARVCALVLVQINYSALALVAMPRHSRLAVPPSIRDTNDTAPHWLFFLAWYRPQGGGGRPPPAPHQPSSPVGHVSILQRRRLTG